ncbi:MAG: type III pantothenate kinase [Cyanobacteriota bacterium]|nr:type III pantothenate kinase [Cyanobacteriota bacterium]
MSHTFDWLGLAIGNSRLHWAWFRGETLVETRDREHFPANCPETILPRPWPNLPVYFASVVPQQSAYLQAYAAQTRFAPTLTEISLSHIPLQGVYPTMGSDRALSVWGAIQTYGLPILVIDAGTALTFTGAIRSSGFRVQGSELKVESSELKSSSPSPPLPITPSPQLIGGAILPGLRLQFRTLGQQTAALPEVNLPQILPPRWCLDTQNAIASGIVYTVLAGIRSFITDWLDNYPGSQIILTGGDANWLFEQLHNDVEIASCLVVDGRLIFWGMRSLVLGNVGGAVGTWRSSTAQ